MFNTISTQLVPPGTASFPEYRSALFVKYDGNIGIHTSNPLEKFHVNSKSLFDGNMDVNGNLSIGDDGWTSLTFDGTNDNNWMLNAHSDGERFFTWI